MSETQGIYEIGATEMEHHGSPQGIVTSKVIETMLDNYGLARYAVDNDEERNRLDRAVAKAMKELEEYDRRNSHVAAMKRLEAEILAAVMAWGETVKGLTWSAIYRKPYERVTWNSKKLDGYAAAHPEILPFRKATRVPANVKLQVSAEPSEIEEAESGN